MLQSRDQVRRSAGLLGVVFLRAAQRRGGFAREAACLLLLVREQSFGDGGWNLSWKRQKLYQELATDSWVSSEQVSYGLNQNNHLESVRSPKTYLHYH